MSDLYDKTAPSTLRAAATTLTGSYVATSELDVDNYAFVTVTLAYTKGGSATLLQFVAEQLFAGGESADWSPAECLQNAGSPSGGAVASEVLDTSYTVTATGNRTLHFRVYGAAKFRLRLKETGTPGGTCKVTAVASRGC